MKWFILLATFVAAVQGVSFYQIVLGEWELFKITHGKAFFV